MMASDRVIPWTMVGAVVGVAVVGAVACYEHAHELVLAHGRRAGCTADAWIARAASALWSRCASWIINA